MTNHEAHMSVWKRLKKAPVLSKVFQGCFRVLDRWGERLADQRRRQYRRQRDLTAAEGGPRVLVVATAGIGNLVEATPLIQAIRALWPQAAMTVLTGGGDLLAGWCVPDVVLSEPAGLAGQSFDHTFFPYWGWTGVPNFPLPCELGQVHCPRLFLNKWFFKPEREINVDMVRRLGYRGICPPLYVSLEAPTGRTFEEPLKIALLAGGQDSQRWRSKRWPCYDQLCGRLLEAYPEAGLYFLGTPGDDFPEALKGRQRVYDLRGQFTLRQTAWFLQQADLAVGNDCGPMHIADAVQTPGLVLFGPTCELKNGPRGKLLPLRADRDCAPCQYQETMAECGGSECMRELSVERVLAAIDRVIASSTRQR